MLDSKICCNRNGLTTTSKLLCSPWSIHPDVDFAYQSENSRWFLKDHDRVGCRATAQYPAKLSLSWHRVNFWTNFCEKNGSLLCSDALICSHVFRTGSLNDIIAVKKHLHPFNMCTKCLLFPTELTNSTDIQSHPRCHNVLYLEP